MGVTIYADRSKIPGKIKLPNVNLLRLNKPTVDVEIPIMEQYDGQIAQLIGLARYKAPTTPLPPPEVGDLLYDSNLDIDWAAIAADLADDEQPKDYMIIDDVYGNFVPNGKYFRCKASGDPRAYLYPATKEIILEHDGEFGRLYFGVCNYSSKLLVDFKLTDPSHKFSVKTINRHQYRDVFPKATNDQRQGGQGTGVGIGSIDSDLEIYHKGGEISGPQESISPKLEINKYYTLSHSVYDNNGKKHVKVELDRNDGNGFKVINEGDVNAPEQFFNMEEFLEWSEFWLRLNTPKKPNQRIWLKNIIMTRI